MSIMADDRQPAQMACAPQGGAIGTAGAEDTADRLLRASRHQCGRGDYPFYSERRMAALSAREQQWRDDLHPVAGMDGAPAKDRALLARLVVDAQLTRRQRLVVRWLAQGLSQRQMAEMLGVSEATVCRLKQSALEQMRRAAQR